MLPEAPARFSTMTGWPSALDSGSARVRADMSGVEPAGKPTRMRTGRDGQAAVVSGVFKLFWAVAHIGSAQTAIKNVAFAARLASSESFLNGTEGTIFIFAPRWISRIRPAG
jgi:hypothetical protein